MNRNQINSGIDANIYQNSNREITGTALNTVLKNLSNNSFNLTSDRNLLNFKPWNSTTEYLSGDITVRSGLFLQANQFTVGSFTSGNWNVLSTAAAPLVENGLTVEDNTISLGGNIFKDTILTVSGVDTANFGIAGGNIIINKSGHVGVGENVSQSIIVSSLNSDAIATGVNDLLVFSSSDQVPYTNSAKSIIFSDGNTNTPNFISYSSYFVKSGDVGAATMGDYVQVLGSDVRLGDFQSSTPSVVLNNGGFTYSSIYSANFYVEPTEFWAQNYSDVRSQNINTNSTFQIENSTIKTNTITNTVESPTSPVSITTSTIHAEGDLLFGAEGATFNYSSIVGSPAVLSNDEISKSTIAGTPTIVAGRIINSDINGFVNINVEELNSCTVTASSISIEADTVSFENTAWIALNSSTDPSGQGYQYVNGTLNSNTLVLHKNDTTLGYIAMPVVIDPEVLSVNEFAGKFLTENGTDTYTIMNPEFHENDLVFLTVQDDLNTTNSVHLISNTNGSFTFKVATPSDTNPVYVNWFVLKSTRDLV